MVRLTIGTTLGTWSKNIAQIFHSVSGRGVKKKVFNTSSIQSSDVTINGTVAICNAFNKYIVTLGHTLSSSLQISGDCMQYVIRNN